MARRQQHSQVVSARGGCERCAGVRWNGKNAQAIAARHHDAHHHVTWSEVTMRTEYGSASRSKTTDQRSML